MIPIRFLISTLAAVSVASLAAGAQKKAPEPRAEPMSESAALAILNSNAEVHEKAVACQELANYGTAKSVPALAALLNQEHLADYARSGLESIRDASAGKALLQALPTVEGQYLAGVVNSLGVRREKAAVPALRTLALDPKRGVSVEAITSLALIASPDAVKVLQDILAKGPANLKVDTAHASLLAAERLAKEGNRSAARSLLEAVAKANPTPQIASVAQKKAAALR